MYKGRLLEQVSVSCILTKHAISSLFLCGVSAKGKKIKVKPPYPYEVKVWDGYMDRDFLQELAKSNPGLDIEGILHDQQEEMKKWEE